MAFLRGSHDCKVIGHRNAVLPILRHLKNNGTVAFLVDHHASESESLKLPFLGKPASVNMGPAVLAVRAKALIMPVALIRRDEKYQIHFLEPLDTGDLSGSFNEKVCSAAEFYTQAVESLIHLAPEQWFWLHNRWKK